MYAEAASSGEGLRGCRGCRGKCRTPAETLAHPVSGVLLITLLTICGVFVRAQVSDGSNAWIIVGVALVHATSWQVYGLCRPAGDVGLLARLSIVVFPAAALLAAWQSGFDGEQVALVYVGVAIAVSIAAVLSRRRRYVRKALPIAMKELWRNVRTYR